METSYALKFDSCGFMTQECPNCARRFKVKLDKSSGNKFAHCPYCDHDGEDWWTRAQRKRLEAVSTKMIADRLNESMRHSKNWKPKKLPSIPDAPIESDDDLPDVVTFACCNETIRHDGVSAQFRCVICGTKV